MTRFTEDGGCVLGWSGDESDEPEQFAERSDAPECPCISDQDDEYDLEGASFQSAQNNLRESAA